MKSTNLCTQIWKDSAYCGLVSIMTELQAEHLGLDSW